jgi:hypothetical protein
MTLSVITLTFVLSAAAGGAAAQECLHGRDETAENRSRREQALKMAKQINLAETVIVGPRTPASKFRPLRELQGVPPAPPGFHVLFYTDGETYSFSIKDKLDPCRYAIFSDQDKDIYEAIPQQRPTLMPATSHP